MTFVKLCELAKIKIAAGKSWCIGKRVGKLSLLAVPPAAIATIQC